MYNRLYGEEPLTSRNKNIEDMDTAVGGVVEELKTTGHYDNTIIMFISDNGPREKTGNNEESASYPLRKRKSLVKNIVMIEILNLINNNKALIELYRGCKGNVYEGGTRVPAFLHYGGFPSLRGKYSELFHAVDILPTLMEIVSKDSLPKAHHLIYWMTPTTDNNSCG